MMVHDPPSAICRGPCRSLAGHGITTIVGGLTPAMLGVLLLNICGIGAAIYFLNILITGQQNHLQNLLDVQERQMSLIVRVHDREFDAQNKMISDLVIRISDLMKQPPPPDVGIPLPLPRP